MTGADRTARVFQQALEVAPELRSTFLEEVCSGDAGLRGEVESLLRHHQPGTIAGMLHPAEPSQSRGWTAASVSVVAVPPVAGAALLGLDHVGAGAEAERRLRAAYDGKARS